MQQLSLHSVTILPPLSHHWATSFHGNLCVTVLNMFNNLQHPWRPWLMSDLPVYHLLTTWATLLPLLSLQWRPDIICGRTREAQRLPLCVKRLLASLVCISLLYASSAPSLTIKGDCWATIQSCLCLLDDHWPMFQISLATARQPGVTGFYIYNHSASVQ